MKIYVTLILAIVTAIGIGMATTTGQHAFALSNSKRYNDGYNNGYSAAQSDSNFNPTCDPSGQYTSDGQHTTIYCTGWSNGYSAGWNTSHGDVNTGTQQSQSSDVNIKGNNNHVDVNQGQSANSGNDFNPDNGGHNSGSGNPNCKVLCIS